MSNIMNNTESDKTFFNIWDFIEEQYKGKIRFYGDSDGQLCVVTELPDKTTPLPQGVKKFQLSEVADNIYTIPASLFLFHRISFHKEDFSSEVHIR